MKTLKIFLSVFLVLGITFSSTVAAQDKGKAVTGGPKTESIKVWGACGMCKDRIEKTVKAEGATSASWDSKTQLLAVTYDASKTNTDALSKKLASVGHDTEKYKAPDDVYAKLPGCCHYERSK
jgi:copper chaperone CopZ